MNINERLDQIEQRAERASEGPWFDEERNLDDPWGATTVYNVFHNGDTPDRDLVAEAAYDNAEFIAHARTDVPALVKALRAALDMHTEEDGAGIFEGDCRGCPYPYPCPTVRAITDALEGK